MDNSTFSEQINQSYTCSGPFITLGAGMLDANPVPNTPINIALNTLNRHGLIAGATGTGKTKTVQLFAELLSEQGVPCLLMDLKGDLSGIGAPGTDHPKIQERQQRIGVTWEAKAAPIEFLSISNEPGVRLRTSVDAFGSILLSQILELNSTQRSVLAVVFKYCRDNKIPLVTLDDLSTVLKHIMGPGAEKFENEYGHISSTSAGAIHRKVIELQQQGADLFFGEPRFDVNELARTSSDGKGVISILRLIDLQSRPKLFSTFMMNLLNDTYQQYPEVGDLEKPKLVIVIDEAHLVFSDASKELLDKISTIIKLIRSKGVGIYFCTQNPKDIPNDVLSQLGLKIQHALRAFTAKDRKAIKLVSENFPSSDYYKVDELLTHLGIGEALVTGLNEKGRPTALAATYLQAPRSRMGLLSEQEVKQHIAQSTLVGRYKEGAKTQTAEQYLQRHVPYLAKEEKNDEATTKSTTNNNEETSVVSKIGKSRLVRQLLNTVVREVTRALMSALGLKKPNGRRKK